MHEGCGPAFTHCWVLCMYACLVVGFYYSFSPSILVEKFVRISMALFTALFLDKNYS